MVHKALSHEPPKHMWFAQGPLHFDAAIVKKWLVSIFFLQMILFFYIAAEEKQPQDILL